MRTLDEDVRDLMEKRLKDAVPNIAAAFGAKAELRYQRGYPVTVNAEGPTRIAGEVAQKVAGLQKVDLDIDPSMGAEDFSFMARERPGAFILVGNGPGAQLHQDDYDFNDDAIPYGCSYWATLAETLLPL